MEAVDSQEPTEPGRVQRLQRELRALSAVNRQRHEQPEGGAVRLTGTTASGARAELPVRRATEGTVWLEQLHLQGAVDPQLVRAPRKGAFVVEGTMRRNVKSGI